MDVQVQGYSLTTAQTTLLTTTSPHGYGYGHYISYYGHYSYILLILMGITVLLGSLLVAYVKKIDSGIMRRSAERERGRCNHRCGEDSDCESDDLKKDLPPPYQIALEMPRPGIEDYSRFFEYTLVRSSNSLSGTPTESQEANCEDGAVPMGSDCVIEVDKYIGDVEPNQNLPSYDEYIQSMSEIDEA